MQTIDATIKKYFQEIFNLSEKSFSELKQIFEFVTINKNEVFIKTGNKNKTEYFIKEGFCRSFLINPEGEEITLSFFKKNSALPPHLIRTKDQLSIFNFQALTELELITFDVQLFHSLMMGNMEIRNFGNSILLNELIRKTEKEIALASLTAKERLMKFRGEFGILENLIAHPIIASYLGITNVSLSRLRAENLAS